jgi:hypothetical protein
MDMLDDGVIGHIEPQGDAEHVDIGRRWGAEWLIGDQRQGDLPPVGRTIQQVLDDVGARVAIHPDVHGTSPEPVSG